MRILWLFMFHKFCYIAVTVFENVLLYLFLQSRCSFLLQILLCSACAPCAELQHFLHYVPTYSFKVVFTEYLFVCETMYHCGHKLFWGITLVTNDSFNMSLCSSQGSCLGSHLGSLLGLIELEILQRRGTDTKAQASLI
jgi:hypothetical protein